jgi:DGQHR domain-containing protein
LLKISYVNHRSLNDPEGVPTYQRLISRTRIRNIGEFIKAGGYFPTNILINFTRTIRFDKIGNEFNADVTFGHLYLPDKYRSAWIIDGQHRLYGFSPIDDKYLDQNIIIIAFEKLPTEEEANLFVTINHEQKSVPKHLLDDLEGELKWGSNIPSERVGSIAARLINILNSDHGEPFYNRITQQGITSTNKTCLTIPALKDALRKSGLLGKAVMHNSNYQLGPLCGKSDIDTLDRARSALNQYFNIIKEANCSQWEKGREGSLCTNTAIQAYILLCAELINYWQANTASEPHEMEIEEIILEIEEYLSPVLDFLKQSSDDKIRQEFQVVFGSGGPVEYFYRLCKNIKTKYPDFLPEGLKEWETEQSEDKILTAEKKIKDIIILIQKHIVIILKSVYGEEKDAYWNKGIPDKTIKSKAYEKSLDEEDALPLENYLDVIDYKKIIESKQNWPYFKDLFNIPEPGEKGYAKNIKWIERLNELRRIPSHPSENRHFKVDDFDYIDYISDELNNRVSTFDIDNILKAAEPARIAEKANA